MIRFLRLVKGAQLMIGPRERGWPQWWSHTTWRCRRSAASWWLFSWLVFIITMSPNLNRKESFLLQMSFVLLQLQLSCFSARFPWAPVWDTFLNILFNLVPLDPGGAIPPCSDSRPPLQVRYSTVRLRLYNSDPLFTARSVFSSDPGSCCQHKVTQSRCSRAVTLCSTS